MKAPGMETHQPCGSGSQIIYAWAMDAPKLDLPEGVGFRVGADSTIKYLVLQVIIIHIDDILFLGSLIVTTFRVIFTHLIILQN